MINNHSILDLKGLVMESYHSGEDPDAIPGGGVKPFVNTAGYGLTVFISKYYDTILDICKSPLNMIAAMDAGNEYRTKLLSTYKANRKVSSAKKDPVEKGQIAIALRMVKQFLLSQGVVVVTCPKEEADDVVGYLTTKLEGNKTVHTVDRDPIALASDNCFILTGGEIATEFVDKNKVTVNGSKQDVVVPAELVTLYKSIVGDASDNYGGVPRLGPAKWNELVETFGEDGLLELDTMVANNEQTQVRATAAIAGSKVLSKLSEEFELWSTMYQVARIAPEIVEPVWDARVPEQARLRSVFEEANCMDLFSKYSRDCYTATLVTKANLEQVMGEINDLLDETPFVPWDYETYDTKKVPEFIEAVGGRKFVDMLNSDITGCSFAFGRAVNKVYYFSVFHKNTDNVSKNVILNILQLCRAEGKEMVAQNVNFEATVTKNVFGYDLHSWEDTKLYAHHVDENTENGLKFLARNYLNYTQTSYDELLEACGASDMAEVTGEEVLSYGADDSVVTGILYSLFNKITSIEGTRQFISEYECPAVQVLMQAHIDGVNVDLEAIEEMAAADDIVIDQSMQAIRGLLEKNCSGPNFAGVDLLFGDQKEYFRVTAKALKGSTKDSITEKVSAKKIQLKANCYYRPLVEVKPFAPFIPTVAGLKVVCVALGIPELEKVSQEYIRGYVVDAGKATWCEGKAATLCELLPPASSDFNANKRSSPAYKKLELFCNTVIEGAASMVTEGTELNLNSPVQRQHLFYLMLNLPIRLRTKVQRGSVRALNGLEGSPSTDHDTILAALANDCTEEAVSWKAEVLTLLDEFTSASTRMKNYWTVYPLWAKGGGEGNTVVHPNFSSCGTVTRRPTGSSPNLLQIAKGETRRMFVPQDDDHVICSIDFASQELRLNADACQDDTWMSAYVGDEPKGLHDLTGCGIFPTLLARSKEPMTDKVEYDQNGHVNYDFFIAHKNDDSVLGALLRKARAAGKQTNFSAQFGATAPTLSRKLVIPEELSKEFLDSYFETFPGLQPWKDKIIYDAEVNKYVVTAYGSRRHCKGIKGGTTAETARWGRQVVNFVIQGTAADILKVVLTGLGKSKLLDKYDSMLIAALYDELLLEIPKKYLYEVITGVSELMSLTVPGGTIPMVPDTSFGPNWYEQYEVGTFPSREVIAETLSKFEEKK